MAMPAALAGPNAHHVSLVALPEGAVSTLFGIYDVLRAPTLMDVPHMPRGAPPPFHVDIVGEIAGTTETASRVSVDVQRPVDAVHTTDIVIVPSIVLPPGGWITGRHARLVEWMRAMHERGAILCSGCSGIFLLAETGLFDGRDATVHYNYARAFSSVHPAVTIHRLFRRTTGLAPGAYRRRFHIPGFARP